MADCLIAIGCNQGDCRQAFAHAFKQIGALPATDVREISRNLKTRPVGLPDTSARFLNAAVRIETRLTPQRLMVELLNIETELGRKRDSQSRDRSIDLDILLYRDEKNRDLVIRNDELEIPHPRMSFRRFVLVPAAQIASDMFHPVCGMTVGQLLDHLVHSENLIVMAIRDKNKRASLVTSQIGIQQLALFNAHWIEPTNVKFFGASSIQKDEWKVVVIDNLELVNTLPATPKLLILSGEFDETNTKVFRGPVWQVQHVSTDEQITELISAIQAMQPFD